MDIKKEVQGQFGRSAASYVTSDVHRNGKDLTKLIELANTTGKEKALDVATGGGHTANALAPLVEHVTAFDLTEAMLRAAEKFTKSNGYDNVDFVQGDAEQMPFADAVFDIVTCRIAPHHFPSVENFIAEAYRVLKPGGAFLLDDNVAPENDDFDQFINKVEKMRDTSHFRLWKKSVWLRMLELHGFQVQEWHRFEKLLDFDDWCRRMRLGKEDQMRLNRVMVDATEDIHRHFDIIIENGRVQSFKLEAILVKAIKRL